MQGSRGRGIDMSAGPKVPRISLARAAAEPLRDSSNADTESDFAPDASQENAGSANQSGVDADGHPKGESAVRGRNGPDTSQDIAPPRTASIEEGGCEDRPESTARDVVTDAVAAERDGRLKNYKLRARKQSIRITDKMVAHAANPNWNDRTMITWWKRNDTRCKPPHDRLIRAVLQKDPSSIWNQNLRSKT